MQTIMDPSLSLPINSGVVGPLVVLVITASTLVTGYLFWQDRRLSDQLLLVLAGSCITSICVLTMIAMLNSQKYIDILLSDNGQLGSTRVVVENGEGTTDIPQALRYVIVPILHNGERIEVVLQVPQEFSVGKKIVVEYYIEGNGEKSHPVMYWRVKPTDSADKE